MLNHYGNGGAKQLLLLSMLFLLLDMGDILPKEKGKKKEGNFFNICIGGGGGAL
jgi:hypothetical protein